MKDSKTLEQIVLPIVIGATTFVIGEYSNISYLKSSLNIEHQVKNFY